MSGYDDGISAAARLIRELPFAECRCEPAWIEVGYHAPECRRQAEADYQKRLLDRLFATVREPEVVNGGGFVPTQPETGSSGSQTAALDKAVQAGR